jgi:hypothetical protein
MSRKATKTTYAQLREASDAICRHYGLSVIEQPAKGRAKTHGEWRAEHEGRDTWRSIIREDLEQALSMTISAEGLTRNLKRMGYEVKWDKELSIKPPGRERFMRPARQLGDEYTTESLRRRFDENFALKRPARPIFQPDPKRGVLYKMLQHCKRSSLFWLYYHYRYHVFLHREAPKTQYVSPQMREEIHKLDSITRQMRMLWRYKLDTLPQLEDFRNGLAIRTRDLERKRKALYNKAAKMSSPSDRQPIRIQIESINTELKLLRRRLRDCTEIKEYSLSGKLVTREIVKATERRERDKQR